ncbi:DNA-binding GntR family transcriptional regulator [Frigoribacterium sp. PvP120]
MFHVSDDGGAMPVPERPTRGPRRLLRDLTFESVLGAIVDGTLRPGERLFEDDIATWLGVSKTPVKEALARLANQGLVEIEANRFTRVAPATAADLLDSLELLGLLHGVALRSAGDADPGEVSRLAATVVRVLDRPGATCSDLLAATGAFLPVSGNPLARQASEPLQNRTAFLSRHLALPLGSPSLAAPVAELRRALDHREWCAAGDAVVTLLSRRTLEPLLGSVPAPELVATGRHRTSR